MANDVARPRAPRGPRVLGAVVLVAGVFLLWTAYDSAGGDFAPDGPWLAPLVVTAGWVVIATWYLVQQFVAPAPPAEPSAPPAEPSAPPADVPEDGDGDGDGVRWLTPAALAAALCGYVLALEPVGFVLSSTAFFVLAARILGSRRSIRDVIVAVLLVLAIYFAFTRLLTIQLPSGVLPI